MDRERAEELAEAVYWEVFFLLDGEPFVEGMEAGRVATVVQGAFLAAALDAEPETMDDYTARLLAADIGGEG